MRETLTASMNGLTPELQGLIIHIADEAATKAASDVCAHLVSRIEQFQSTESMPPVEGSIDTMKYKYRQRVSVTENGQTIIKWAVGNSLRELQNHILRLQGAVSSGSNDEDASPTFAQFIEEWTPFRQAKVAESTFNNTDRRIIKELMPVFGSRRLNEITPVMVQEYLNTMRDSCFNTVKRKLALLKVIFRDARIMGRMASNPADDPMVSIPTRRSTETLALTEEERRRIYCAIPQLPDNERRYFALLFYTGIRPEEALALTWDNIHMDEGTVCVRSAMQRVGNNAYKIGETKSRAGRRDIPMQDELIAALQPVCETGLIFQRADGTPYTPQTQRRLWQRIQKLTGFNGTAYQLRRNMGTMMAEQGVNDKAAQCIMGHSNIATTLKYYAKPTQKLLATAGEQMKRGFSDLGM